MKFALEPFNYALVEEMEPLWKAHDAETPQLGLPLMPDIAAYESLATIGSLRIFTARLAGQLVGYQVFFVANHPHRLYSLEATQDMLYLAISARRGTAGLRFIRFCDEVLREEGVKVIHHPIDAKHDLGVILRRMGYELTDLTYAKKIQEVA